MFFAAGTDRIVASTDGTNWIAQTVAVSVSLQQAIYGRGLFLATGESPTGQPVVMVSSDGLAWQQRTDWPNVRTFTVGSVLVGAFQQQVYATDPLVFPPVLWPGSVRRRSDGRVWVMADTDPGQIITLEASQDLHDWRAVKQTTNQVSTFDLIDDTAQAASHRFYRLRR
jgi:hypothetical protein